MTRVGGAVVAVAVGSRDRLTVLQVGSERTQAGETGEDGRMEREVR